MLRKSERFYLLSIPFYSKSFSLNWQLVLILI